MGTGIDTGPVEVTGTNTHTEPPPQPPGPTIGPELGHHDELTEYCATNVVSEVMFARLLGDHPVNVYPDCEGLDGAMADPP